VSAPLAVEVVYAQPDEQYVVALRVAAGTTLREAIEQSSLPARLPEIDLSRIAVGVFGQVRGLDEPVREGDRIEIYRKLLVDPKARRRKAAAR
jgi:uncharacterized protein